MAELSPAPATRFARAALRFEPLDWWRLEARAWEGSPDMRRALAFFAPAVVWKDLAKNVNPNPLTTFALLVWHLIGLGAPVLAMFVMIGWMLDSDVDMARVWLAGILAGAGALSAGSGLVISGRRPETVDARSAHMIGYAHVIPAGAALVIAVMAIAQGRADGPIWVLAIAADVVVGVLHFVIFRPTASEGSERWRRNLQRLSTARDAVPVEERLRVTADIHAAVEELRRAGYIDDHAVAQALEAPLGGLGVRMAPRKDMTPTGNA